MYERNRLWLYALVGFIFGVLGLQAFNTGEALLGASRLLISLAALLVVILDAPSSAPFVKRNPFLRFIPLGFFTFALVLQGVRLLNL